MVQTSSTGRVFFNQVGMCNLPCKRWINYPTPAARQISKQKSSTSTLPETKSSPLKMVVSNRNLLFQGAMFRGQCYVSFRECRPPKFHMVHHGFTRTEHDGFKIRNLDDFQVAFWRNFRRKNFYAPKIIKHSPNPFREDVEYQPLMVSML